MAALHGKGGSASFTSLTFELKSWSIDASADTAEATVMGATWKTHEVGFNDWTATCECILPKAGIGLTALGTEATLTMKSGTAAVGARQYSGTAICTGVSPSGDKDGIPACTMTFQGKGTLTEAAAT